MHLQARSAQIMHGNLYIRSPIGQILGSLGRCFVLDIVRRRESHLNYAVADYYSSPEM